MKKINVLLAFLMAQSPFGYTLARPVDEIIQNFTSNLAPKKTPPKSLKTWDERKAQYCLFDDLVISQIEDGLFRELRKNIESLNLPELARLNFDKISGLTALEATPAREIGGIAEFNWKNSKSGSLKDRLGNFAKIEFSELKVVEYLVNPYERTPEVKFSKAKIKTRLDVRGYDKKKRPMQDRLVLELAVSGKDTWKIDQIEVLNAATLVQNAEPAFEDVTAASGLDAVSVNLRTEALRRGGYALAVTDYNNDEIPDIFVGHRENAEMFVADKDGKFKKVATPLDGEKYTKTAVFSDFSNSGKRDVVINRFLRADGSSDKNSKAAFPAQVAFYKNVDGSLVEQPNKFGAPADFKNPMPAAVADFNGDGLNDVYIGYPGVQDFSQFGKPSKSLQKYQGLFMNDGNGGFTDSTASLKFKEGMAAEAFDAHLFPHSSLAVDLNQDQKMDLVVLDDRGHLSPAFVNLGGGRFKESSEKIGISNYSYAMAISSGDINNDGLIDLGLTNVNFNEISRIKSYCSKHRGPEIFSYDTAGLRIFKAQKTGVFDELSSSIFEDAGEGMGGITFIDYNNDGMLDIYLVNGLWSGTKNGQNFGSFFASAMQLSKTQASFNLSERNDLRFMDVLQSFSGRLGDYTNSKTITASPEKPSLAGFQRNRLYRNNGDGSFTDVAFLEGVDAMADGYIVGKMDFNRDGMMDLVLRNADPGTKEYQFPALQLFKNKKTNPEKSVVLTFEGTKLSREALGLFVKGYAKGWQQVAHLEGNSGSMQQQHLIHFGLGKNTELEKIEVYWPSGIKQTLKNVKPGYHHIVEPKDGLAKD